MTAPTVADREHIEAEDDQRCPECGFLGCICFDDDDQPDEHDDDMLDECGMMSDGCCTLAGTEFCDWDCPRNRPAAIRAKKGEGE